MNELTLKLFHTISGAEELDDNTLALVFPWLEAALRVPYLTPEERGNALVLLDFLEGTPGGEVFTPLYRAVRTRLSFSAPMPWDMEFPENYRVSVGGEELNADGLRARGIDHVDFRVSKPIRNSMEYVTTRRLFSDGRVEYLPEFEVFSGSPAGERHLFHVYGEKALLQ